MDIDKTPKTEFGWRRAVAYTLFTIGIWILCWAVTRLVASSLDLYWVRASFPGTGLAIALGVAWEYIRRDKARKQRA